MSVATFDPSEMTDEQLDDCLDERQRRRKETESESASKKDEKQRDAKAIAAGFAALGERPDPEEADSQEVVRAIVAATAAIQHSGTYEIEGCLLTAYYCWVNDVEPADTVPDCVGAFWYRTLALAVIAMDAATKVGGVLEDDEGIWIYGSAWLQRAIEAKEAV